MRRGEDAERRRCGEASYVALLAGDIELYHHYRRWLQPHDWELAALIILISIG